MKNNAIPVFILFFLGACGPYKHAVPTIAGSEGEFVLSSADFRDNNLMPRAFACDGINISPALKWSGAPSGVKSFILTMRSPDSASGDFLHWAVVDIPAAASGIERNTKFPPNSRELKNDFTTLGYSGPCPPSGSSYRFVFTLYAVDAARFNDAPAPLDDFLKDHTLAKAALTGIYKKK